MPDERGPRGRHREAAVNDERIFAAARAVLVDDPGAPISAIGAAAGVGKAALYRRYPSKELLLAAVAEDLTARYAAVIDAALDGLGRGDPAAAVLADFLASTLATETHGTYAAMVGRFEPTPRDRELSAAGQQRGEELVRLLQAAGALRTDVGWLDLNKLLEGLAAIRSRDPARTPAVRARFAAVVQHGLAPSGRPLPDVSLGPVDFWPGR
jgi:AcrR family transcriptional regulator